MSSSHGRCFGQARQYLAAVTKPSKHNQLKHQRLVLHTCSMSITGTEGLCCSLTVPQGPAGSILPGREQHRLSWQVRGHGVLHTSSESFLQEVTGITGTHISLSKLSHTGMSDSKRTEKCNPTSVKERTEYRHSNDHCNLLFFLKKL